MPLTNTGKKILNNMKRKYNEHRIEREKRANMKEGVIAYKEAGGLFKRPIITKT